MLKILLCCGGGFSSSYIVERMKKDILNKHLEEQLYIDYSPFTLSMECIDQYDIMICCPHLYAYIPTFINENHLDKPIYVLPPKMYGNMKIEEIYQDALDIIDLYQKNKKNPVCFPNEENVMKIKRQDSYKKTYLSKTTQ